jgi:hypothetical protein
MAPPKKKEAHSRATKLTSSQGEKREYLDPRLKPQALLAGAIAFIGA